MSISSASFCFFPQRLLFPLLFKTPISKTLLPTKLNFPKPYLFSSSITIEPFSITKSSNTTTTCSVQPIEDLPPKLQEIISLFQSVQQPKAKYEQLLFYGKNLTPLDTKFKTKDNKVQGCVSQVWVRAYLDSDNNVQFQADSDSVLTKGLAALLVQGLSGQPVSEILKLSPDFVTLLGIQQSLSPSRNNGFLNMLNMMKKKALEVYKEAEKGEIGGGTAEMNGTVKSEMAMENLDLGRGGIKERVTEENKEESVERAKVCTGLGSRGEKIKEILEKELSPDDLEVEDVSYQHSGHAGVRGSDGETHFNLRVVSKEFEGKSLVKRHRLVYNLLQEELQSGLHALSIVAKTPSEVN